MSSSTLTVWNSVIAGLGNLSVVTYGVDAKHTVAIQCRGGKSWGRYFVFNGPLELSDRYDGMKGGLGAGGEIFQPTGHGAATHQTLDTAGYENILVCAEKRFRGTDVLGSAPNQWLHDHMATPMWKWSFKRWKRWITCAYAAVALAPLSIFATVRLICGQSIVAELVHGLCFAMTAYFCATLLDVEREVTYIRVPEEKVAAGSVSLWYRLRGRAMVGPPGTAQEAVEDVARGQIRQEGNDVLVPVIAVQPSLGFWPASWLATLRQFRPILLSVSLLVASDRDPAWGMTFAFCAWLQAWLQKNSAQAFCVDTLLYEVNWFRRMPQHTYPEEYRPYRWDLG